MDRLQGGLKDIFSTILKNQQGGDTAKALPQIIVLHGNGNVLAPGGTIHVYQTRPGPAVLEPGEP